MSVRSIDWRIYGLVDNIEFARQLLGAGVKVIQYRNKNETDEAFVKHAREVRELCAQHGAVLIINDRYQLVDQISADGVHVGLQDEDVERVSDYLRERLGDNVVIGFSVKTVEDARRGKEKGASYVCVSPLFDTPNKDEEGVGLQALREIASVVGKDIPVLAIGGITEKNLSLVIEAGAEGVAMIGELQTAASEGEVKLREKIERMSDLFSPADHNEKRYEDHR
jgi:thiamine-phosphate pyrophosphorylase